MCILVWTMYIKKALRAWMPWAKSCSAWPTSATTAAQRRPVTLHTHLSLSADEYIKRSPLSNHGVNRYSSSSGPASTQWHARPHDRRVIATSFATVRMHIPTYKYLVRYTMPAHVSSSVSRTQLMYTSSDLPRRRLWDADPTNIPSSLPFITSS